MNFAKCLRPAAVACTLFLFVESVLAQEYGSIEGRVFSASSDTYLNNARVSVSGTGLEAFTDATGRYRFAQVQAGSREIIVFYTGLAPKTVGIVVKSGEVARLDITLSSETSPAAAGERTVTLDAFVVAASRETNAAAIAIHEQRFAPNFKSVVSTDQFGNVPDGNAGDFLKFLPGVSVNYSGGEVTSISVGGMPPSATPIFMDGMPVAGAGTGMDRSAGVGFSVNNMSRIEVTKSPTPDSPASAIGGSVNLVQRSAFERSRPELLVKTYLTARSDELHISKSPGPGRKPTRKIHPAAEINYVAPVNQRFGFTLAALLSRSYSNQDQFIQNWLPSSGPVPNNGLFAPTTYDKPFATQFQIFDAPKQTTKRNAGLTADWKPYRDGVLSVGLQYNQTYVEAQQRRWVVATNGSANFGPTFTYARAERTNSATQQISLSFEQEVKQFMPTVKFRHKGPTWEFDSGWAYSHAHTQYYDKDKGFFRNMDFRRVNLIVNLIGLSSRGIPASYEAFDHTGRPIDNRDGSNLFLQSVQTSQLTRDNTVKSGYANATRTVRIGVPIRTKLGFDVATQEQDTYAPTYTWTYLGPDRLPPNVTAGITDTGTQTLDNYFSRDYIDQSFSARVLPFGAEKLQWINQYKIGQLFRDQPAWFTPTNSTSDRQSRVNTSQNMAETVSALYLRGDTKLFRDRLSLVAGVRWERTDDKGDGALFDLNAKYQKTANGTLVDGNPNQAGIQPVLIPGWASLTPLEQNEILYVERGAHIRKHYADYYPSVNALYALTPRINLRASWARTIARPNYNSLVPALNYSEPNVAVPVITVNNPNLVPWTASSLTAGAEYYFDSTSPGLLSIRARHIDIQNFFSALRYPTVESAAAILERYGVDPADFPDYQVQTTVNLGDARITGIDAEYRQKLAFLPEWARGLSVFGTITVQQVKGSNLAAFGNSGFPDKNGSWGITLARPRFTVSANWNYRGKQRAVPITGAGIPAPENDTYAYDMARLYLDLSFDVRLTKRWALFGYARNATNVHEEVQRFGASTPEYAKVYSIQEFGAYYTFGVKATF